MVSQIKHYIELMRSIFNDKKVILLEPILAIAKERLRLLRQVGALPPLVLSAENISYEPPKDLISAIQVLPATGSDFLEMRLAFEQAIENLSIETEQLLKDYDPHGEAMVLAAPFLSTNHLGFQRVYGLRRAEWIAFENKCFIDSFWDKIGVQHPPCAIERPDSKSAENALRRLDQGLGTVWSGDICEGVNAGGIRVKWVRKYREAKAVVEFFKKRCRYVRIAPFMEGIPCSIHGIVFPNYVAVFRPVEIIVLRKPEQGEFLYAGTSTFWDPSSSTWETMQAIAKKTGEALRSSAGYRGPFGIDGILTRNGFLPTELNSRYTAGMSTVAQSVRDLPLDLICVTSIEGEELYYQPAILEDVVIKNANESRKANIWTLLSTVRCPDTRVFRLHNSAKSHIFKLIEGEDDCHSKVCLEPSPMGCLVRFCPNPKQIKAGNSIADIAALVFALVYRKLGLVGGQFESAKEL